MRAIAPHDIETLTSTGPARERPGHGVVEHAEQAGVVAHPDRAAAHPFGGQRARGWRRPPSLERDLGVEPHVAAAAANVLRAIRVDRT